MLLENLNVKWFTLPVLPFPRKVSPMQVYQVASRRVVEKTPTSKAYITTLTTKHFTLHSVGPEVATRLLAGDNPDTIKISTVPVAPLDNDAGTIAAHKVKAVTQ
jgi:hypothetical protein